MDEIIVDSADYQADELQPALQDGMHHKGVTRIENVSNHRFLLSGFSGKGRYEIYGDPGSCFANLLDGPEVTVHGDCEDDMCDTMQNGTVVIHGSVGDVACQAMQGGRVYIKNDAGTRTGLQMRQFRDKMPVLVIGGTTGDFLCEYMAGGITVVLNKDDSPDPVGICAGSGMIGGKIYIRGWVNPENISLAPETYEILNYLSVHTEDKSAFQEYCRKLGSYRKLAFHVLEEFVPKETALRIKTLFYENVPLLSVDYRKLTDTEIRGEPGKSIKEFCERFSIGENFLDYEYTVIELSAETQVIRD